MEKLNIEQLKGALRGLGVPSAGTKNDMLARLQVLLEEGNISLSEALRLGEKERPNIHRGSQS